MCGKCAGGLAVDDEDEHIQPAEGGRDRKTMLRLRVRWTKNKDGELEKGGLFFGLLFLGVADRNTTTN